VAEPSAASIALGEVERLTAAGSFQNARVLVDKLLLASPDDARVHLAAASLFRKMGLNNLAIAEYKLVNKLNPQHLEPLAALSELYLESLDIDQSLAFARLAVALNNESKEARSALARALLAGDRLTDADKEVSHLLRRFPNDQETLLLAYRLNRKRGSLMSARAFLGSTIKQAGPNPQLLYELAELLEMAGDCHGALDSLDRLLTIQPDSLKGRTKIASILEFSCHDYDAAIIEYRKLLKLDPESVTAEAGIERCQSKKNDLAFELKVLIHHLINAINEQFFQPRNKHSD
jgi:tetratricopeptide (TPR) repeat protein